MPEERIDVVRYVVVDGEPCALVVTTERSILLPEAQPPVGGVVGAVLRGAFADSGPTTGGPDYWFGDLEALAARPGSLSIPHASLSAVRVSKGLGGYRVVVEFAGPSGKRRKFSGRLQVPEEDLEMRMQMGVGKEKATLALAWQVRDAFAMALPPAARDRVVSQV